MKLNEHLRVTKGYDNPSFRAWFRQEEIPKIYNPLLHVGFNLSVLLAAIIINFALVSSWNLPVFGTLVFTFLLGNVVVWTLHKYPLHRRYKFWSFPYDTHTVMHHRYFTADFITYDDRLDYYAIFFPAAVVGGFVLVGQPLFFYGSAYLFGADVGHAFAGGAAAYFLMYEFVHWTSHLSADHFLIKVPWLRHMRTHHMAHHNPRLMGKFNFCIVYPMMDLLMGTKHQGNLPEENVTDHFEVVKSSLHTD